MGVTGDLVEERIVAKDRRKIEKKRKKEAVRAKRTAAHASARKRDAAYPKVTVAPSGGDIVLVKRIRSLVKDISLEESRGCPPDVADLVARFMRDGAEETKRHIKIRAAMKYDHQIEVDHEVVLRFRDAVTYVGQRVFEQLPEVYQEKLLPDYYFYPLLAPEGMRIQFGFLDYEERETGRGYYSQHKPTVTINGTDWIVCFSEHAIERVVERSSFDQQMTYSHYMDCANYFYGCTYFEPVVMAQGTPAIRLYMTESLGESLGRYREYLRKITGIEGLQEPSALPAYVLGYCHVDCKGKFAKATSFWYPGFDGTPEDTLVRTSGLPKAEKRRLLEMANDNKKVRVVNEGRHEAIRWYHDNGVPQVVPLARGLFTWAPHPTRAPIA